MNVFQIVLLFFLVVPLLEIYLLLKIGSVVGIFPTVLLVVTTAVVGAWLLRVQGFSTWVRLQKSLAAGTMPALEIIEGPILLVGGALLLTPGFFTDLLGFICLIPQTRRRIALYLIEKHMIVPASTGRTTGKDSRTIEGEYKKEE